MTGGLLDYVRYLGWRAGVLLRTRAVKAVGALSAFVAAVVLFLVALAVESYWVFLAAGLGIWVLAVAGVWLAWSAAYPKPVRDWDIDLDGMPVVVDHGPVKPPYGTPERAAYDRDVAS